MTPEQIVGVSEKVTPASLRAGASEYGADTRAGASMYGADQRRASASEVQQQKGENAQLLAAMKSDLEDRLTKLKLQHQDSWNQAKTAATENTQNAVTGRAMMNRIGMAQAQHERLFGQLSGELQKAAEAGALIDPKVPLPDGQEFSNPWTGKPMTMGPGVINRTSDT